MLIWDVENLYEFIKEKLIKDFVSKEISAMEGEHFTIFHMHGLAGFYGPKLLIKLCENCVELNFKIFSMLTSKVTFQLDSKDYLFYPYYLSEIDIIPINKDKPLTKEEILELANTYAKVLKTLVINRDTISSKLFKLANTTEDKLIFNRVTLPVNSDYRDYRIAVKEHNVYLDDLFNEGYFPSKSFFKSVVKEIHGRFLSTYKIDEINWYQLKKDGDLIKVDKLIENGDSITSVSFDKKFLSNLISNEIKTLISTGDRK